MQISPPGIVAVNNIAWSVPGGAVTLVNGVWTNISAGIGAGLVPGDIVLLSAGVRATLNAATTLFQLRFNRGGGSVANWTPNEANIFSGMMQERFPAGAGASIQSLSTILICTVAGTPALDFDGFVDGGNGSVAVGDFFISGRVFRP